MRTNRPEKVDCRTSFITKVLDVLTIPRVFLTASKISAMYIFALKFIFAYILTISGSLSWTPMESF